MTSIFSNKFRQAVHHYWLPTIFFFIFILNAWGQSDSSVWAQKPEVSFSGYVDVFYAYDFNEPNTDSRQPFFYNHNRHNEFNLNNGVIKVSAKQLKYRSNFALQAGTYAMDNYAAEPAVFQHIYEANAGISLNKKNNLWIDAGIIGSHIGFESAFSKDCWTVTRSLSAENSPYYLSGVKLTWSLGENWEAAAIICNGWQRIKKVRGNSLPAFGTQVKYTTGDRLIINWSTFAGTEYPDTARRMRYFNNFYLQSRLTKRMGILAGFDIGLQEALSGNAGYDSWFAPAIIVRHQFAGNWAMAIRAEYYEDKNGVIVATGTSNGFQTSGLSLNLDYNPAKNTSWRVEGRWLNSADKIFQSREDMGAHNFAIVSSLAVSF